jgi:amino acid adenylation domain-containing protein
VCIGNTDSLFLTERAELETRSAWSRGSIEGQLTPIWCEVLDLEEIGTEDDFFELGGNSLQATQIVSRIRQRLQVDLPVRSFFRARTIAQLAAQIANLGRSAGPDETLTPMAANNEHKASEASFAQQRLWIFDRRGQAPTAYNVAYAIWMQGRLDLDALRQALHVLNDRHESLRAVFGEEKGIPQQVVAPPASLALPLHDLSATPSAADAAEREIERASRHTFDLAQGPLWNARLLRLAPEEHVLVWTMHHVVTDGWSMGVLFRELNQAYEAIASGRSVDLPALPVQYADFTRWQRDWLQRPVFQEQCDFWKNHLAGAIPVVSLPMSRPRPKSQTFRGETLRFDFTPAEFDALQRASRRFGGTPFVTMLAAFQVLIYRYTRQSDLVIGIPVANRSRPEIEPVVGFFVNTLALRGDLAGNPTFSELIRHVSDRVSEAFSHQDLPFDRLVQELRHARDASYHPVFQIMFNYRQVPSRTSRVNGMTWRVQPISNDTSKFDLTIHLDESPEGLEGALEYNADLFDQPAMQRLAGHYRVLLASLLADPEQRIDDANLLDLEEREQLLESFNRTQVPGPSAPSFLVEFEKQAHQHPKRIALRFEGTALTYADVNARANQIAHHLRELGAGPDVLVGLCLERSPDLVTSALAILKAGAAYVPLDPAFPRDRLDYYVQDSAMGILLTDQRLQSHFHFAVPQIVCLDRDGAGIAAQSRENPKHGPGGHDLAYIIYTSGSTGRPKGVQIEHAALVNMLHALAIEPGLRPEDVVLAVSTLSFDIHTVDLWLPLMVGAQIDLARREVAIDGRLLLKKLHDCGATVLQATPATWRLLLACGWEGSARLKALCGGERMPADLAAALFPRTASLWNMYGPTETTVYSTLTRVTAPTEPMPIGKPIANTRTYILDSNGQPVPIGVPGELHIAGSGLARGYLGQSALTAEKFVSDPFGCDAEARMYRTGDLVRQGEDGTLYFLGRLDHQVKIRGFRIELGEIEAVLSQQPTVHAAVVIASGDEAAGPTLVAFIIPQNRQAVDVAQLRRVLQEKLPDYMIPSRIVSMPAFPHTPNGKIDRRALAALDAGPQTTQRTFVAPRYDAERELVAIWQEVLKVAPISVDDDFFKLGGHSLLAAVLMARIRDQLGYDLSLETLFTSPTVEQLAALLQTRLEVGSRSSLVPFNESGSQPPLFLIAGVGGHVFTFHKFARLLGSDQPSYGVKAIGVDGTESTPNRFEAIAARYADEIQAIRPRGPYVLGGYSIGGLIAFELALQLQKRGEQVPLLFVFDRGAPDFPKLRRWPQRAAIHLRNLLVHSPQRRQYLRDRWHNLKHRVFIAAGLAHRNAPVIEAVGPLSQETLARVWGALETARYVYRPAGQFRGRIVLFRAKETPDTPASTYDDPLLGWEKWQTGGIEDLLVPGAHLELFQERNLPLLADRVKASMEMLMERGDA